MLQRVSKMVIVLMIMTVTVMSDVYGQQRGKIINISVSVGKTGQCGNAGGSFQALYEGKEIEIIFTYIKTIVYQGNKMVKGDEGNIPMDVFCPGSSAGLSEFPHPLAGVTVKVEGFWIDSESFHAMKIYLPTNSAGMAGSSDNSDYNQMMAAARNYVKVHSAPGFTFELKLLKQVNNYALLGVEPTGKWAKLADPAGVISQKIGGKWVPQDLGTDLVDWEERVPELFKR
jgi:hypothetical protein